MQIPELKRPRKTMLMVLALCLLWSVVFVLPLLGLLLSAVIIALSAVLLLRKNPSPVALALGFLVLAVLGEDEFRLVVFAVVLLGCVAVLVASKKSEHFFVRVGAIGCAVLAGFVGFVLTRPPDFVFDYVNNSDNAVINFLAAQYYIDEDSLRPGDSGFERQARLEYASYWRSELSEMLIYYTMHFAAAIGLLGALIFGLLMRQGDYSRLYLPKEYAVAVLMPCFIVGLIALLLPPAIQSTTTGIFHSAVVLPNAAVGLSLVYFAFKTLAKPRRMHGVFAVMAALVVLTTLSDVAQLVASCVGIIALFVPLRRIILMLE